MDKKRNTVDYEEVLDSEIDDIWDIFFPYMKESDNEPQKMELNEKKKPKRHLRFLTMGFL